MILETTPAADALRGDFLPPGDKSISHRAVIFASLADGESAITDILQSEDVKATMNACRQLGAKVTTEGAVTRVLGTGGDGLKAPAQPLDMGNSGTAMRLLAGVLAAQSFDSELVGDESLSRRPMRRIVEPLARMGARIETTGSGTAPLRIFGTPGLKGLNYQLPVASAQIKSCVLLAGLYASGTTCVSEPLTSRDHTEKMLPGFGVELLPPCCVQGGSKLKANRFTVPADISSATFFMVGAAIVPGSEVVLRNVGVNATRDGILRVLGQMGADVEVLNPRTFGQEPVADVRVRYTPHLRAIDLPERWVPSLIDELPAIMVLAARASGTTRIRGAAELRVKESDRIAVMATGLARLGVSVKEYPDGLDIEGGPVRGGEADGAGDHRCAMSFCMLGQVAHEPVRVAGAGYINTSYPEFVHHLKSVGGNVEPVSAQG